jgi:hypothetical protein
MENLLLRNKNNGNSSIADDKSITLERSFTIFFGHFRAPQVSSELIDRNIHYRPAKISSSWSNSLKISLITHGRSKNDLNGNRLDLTSSRLSVG